MENITRAMLVMDGNYVRKWWTHLAEEGFESNYYSIDFSNLIKYIGSVIEKDFGCRCVFVAKKLYMGTNAEVDLKNQKFYRALDDAGIQKNTFPLRNRDDLSGRAALKEEACDTTIVFSTAKDFYSAARENRFDTLVLFAGDGDLTPLVSGMQAEGVKTVVVYYDFTTPFSTTRASQKLLETADKVVNFGSFLTERVNKDIISIFKKLENPLTDAGPFQNSSSYEPRKPVVVIKRKSASDFINEKYPYCTRTPYTYMELVDAVCNIPKKDADGFVLVAQLGKYLEYKTGKTLPPGVKLKDLLHIYSSSFDTKEIPAYSVRLSEAGKKILAGGK